MIARLPFRLTPGAQPLIVFPVHLDARGPFDAILDTGAAVTAIAPPLAGLLELERVGTRTARGAGGEMTVEMAKLGSLRAGGWSSGPLQVAVTQEVERIARAAGARAQIDVGADALRGVRLTVDYVASALTLATPGEEEAGPGARGARADLEFQLASPQKPLILVDVVVEDGGPCRFAVDTGASTTVISSELAARLGLHTRAMPSMTGGGGAVAASAAVARSLTIGNATLSQVRVAVADFVAPLARALGAPLDGILGYNVLRRFRVTIDYPAGRLRLD